MDPETLVKDRLDDGRKLIEHLSQNGFDVATAYWLKANVDGKWRFYIASPGVNSEKPVNDYGRLLPIARSRPRPFLIEPSKIRLVDSADPVAKDIVAYLDRFGHDGVPIRYKGIRLGNLSVEDAYLYPVAVAAHA